MSSVHVKNYELVKNYAQKITSRGLNLSYHKHHKHHSYGVLYGATNTINTISPFRGNGVMVWQMVKLVFMVSPVGR